MYQQQTRPRIGWLLFAAVLMLAKGAFSMFIGLLWGDRITGLLGLLTLSGAIAIFLGLLTWGRIMGSVIALGSLSKNLSLLYTRPLWAVSLVTFDLVLLYMLWVPRRETPYTSY
jgi:hypothetical protein